MKWSGIGKSLVSVVLGNLPKAIGIIESLGKLGDSNQKQGAAIGHVISDVNTIVEDASHKQLLTHPRVIAWLKKANDIAVEGHNLFEELAATPAPTVKK